MNYCMFPATKGVINQTEGIDRNGNVISISSSHKGYKAIDISPDGNKFYAPCKLKCVYHQRDNDGKSACLSVFESLEEVKCPAYSGTTKITIFCTHGGPNVSTEKGALRVGFEFEKGMHFYSPGTDAGIDATVGPHIHMSVKRGSFTGMSLTDPAVSGDYYYCLDNDEFINDIFYFDKNHEVTFGNYIDAIPFDFVTADGQWNGWIADGSEWYYYENGVKVSGWIKTSDGWFYLDPTNGNAMATGWIKIGNSWFYLNPKQGAPDHNTDYAGGAMRTGWVKSGNDWYYMSPSSGVMQTSLWVASGSVWYYVLSSGKMATNCQILDGGKYYAFDSEGKCLNGAGQSSPYNTTTYPLKS
ncbi:N-acetylmuramoyl-L-alanine amidase family protein [Dielma fastidiosa]|uniref:N-acetylmuramoyl-L-alanine amidase family protein n=1 Tax=Dielma fastidiosa TaxID=1034346 RepID=UPI000E4EA063|nr:N-acetylmuramoyl-L-alanine amidase family protein [Dielma fastidiosa]RHN01456.1 N-acetylmuramoyl-L-alanine amidase family protein [Dielma fastidiosa]